MKKQKKVSLKKILKQKARRKDFKKKKNIIKNIPKVSFEHKKPVYKQKKEVSAQYGEGLKSKNIMGEDKRPILDQVGFKIIKVKTYAHNQNVFFPQPIKNKKSKNRLSTI